MIWFKGAVVSICNEAEAEMSCFENLKIVLYASRDAWFAKRSHVFNEMYIDEPYAEKLFSL